MYILRIRKLKILPMRLLNFVSHEELFMKKRKRYIIIVEWTDIFGGDHNAEIPCTNELNLENQLSQLWWRYKKDPTVSQYKVYSVVR